MLYILFIELHRAYALTNSEWKQKGVFNVEHGAVFL